MTQTPCVEGYWEVNNEEAIAVVRPAFEADEIWPDVDRSKSMFLLVPHMFAHIVLKDASKYEAAMGTLRRIQGQLNARDEKFEWRLRSTWTINRTEYGGVYYNGDGTIRPASRVHVELNSGSRTLSLNVAFTDQAGHDLAAATGASKGDHERHKREQVQKTQTYIEMLLAAGGEMAWDPLWPGCDQLTIDSAALAWILQEETRLAVG